MSIPETTAAERLADLAGTHLQPAWLTRDALVAVMSKVVAARPAVRQVFDDLDADPNHIGDRGTVLQQQRRNELSDADALLEEAAWHKSEWARLCGLAHQAGANPLDIDRTERDADEDDARLSREAADEKHADAMRSVAS